MMKWVPHTSVLRVGVLVFFEAEEIQAVLRARGLHFLTFSCYRRLPLLGTMHARNVFVDALEKMRERYGFLLVGYVVMPEHVHLLITEPLKGSPSVVLKVLKQRVSRDLRKKKRGGPTGQLCLPFMRRDEGLGRFWQPRFYDFNIYSAKKKQEKLEYMHANPVTRKLVEHPKDWPWSSFSSYAKGKAGLVTIDAVE
jgi:putative transposase